MRRTLAIDDHLAFHLAVARAMLAGGGLYFLMAYLPAYFAPWGGGWLHGLLFVGLLGAAIAVPRGARQIAVLLVCAVLGGAAGAVFRDGDPVLSLLGWSLSLGLALYGSSDDLQRWQRLALGAAGGLLAFGAGFLPPALRGLEAVLPGEMAPVLSGMAVGLVTGSAAILRQVRVQNVAVDQDIVALALPPAENDEIASLVQQAIGTYKETAPSLTEHPQALEAAEDLVKKIARFGKRWREIEEQARRSDKAALTARLADLSARQEATEDDQVRAEYERARGALQAQLQYLGEIDRGRERAVARLHHQVATLERLRLSALRHRSVDATKAGEELRLLVDDLTRAGQDMDVAAEALAEVPS
jgi:hypothetical protein